MKIPPSNQPPKEFLEQIEPLMKRSFEAGIRAAIAVLNEAAQGGGPEQARLLLGLGAIILSQKDAAWKAYREGWKFTYLGGGEEEKDVVQ